MQLSTATTRYRLLATDFNSAAPGFISDVRWGKGRAKAMTEKLLTTSEAGEILSMTRGALAQLRYLGTGPKFVKLTGRAVRYRPEDIDEWIESNVRSCTAPSRS